MPTKAKTKKPTKKAAPKELVNSNFNTKWFKDQLQRADMTNRKVAMALGVSHSLISHMFVGKRKMPIEEVAKWAELLGVSAQDVARNAGLEIPQELMGDGGATQVPSAKASVPLKGWVDNQLKINWGEIRGAKTAPNPLPGDLGRGVACVRCQTSGGPFETLDGTLIYYREFENGFFDPESLGRLCVVELKDGFYIRILKRGYSTGRYNLALFNGALGEEDAVVASCTPVLWMKL